MSRQRKTEEGVPRNRKRTREPGQGQIIERKLFKFGRQTAVT